DRYRQRVEAQARQWLRQGLDRRDPALLERVVAEAFCTRAAEEALGRLGDFAFERGDFERARAYWHTLAPPAGGQPGDADSTCRATGPKPGPGPPPYPPSGAAPPACRRPCPSMTTRRGRWRSTRSSSASTSWSLTPAG